jgi:hypothetical protein
MNLGLAVVVERAWHLRDTGALEAVQGAWSHIRRWRVEGWRGGEQGFPPGDRGVWRCWHWHWQGLQDAHGWDAEAQNP